MAGRPPKPQALKTGAYTKEKKEREEKSTPIYQSQEFIAPDYLTDKEKELA